MSKYTYGKSSGRWFDLVNEFDSIEEFKKCFHISIPQGSLHPSLVVVLNQL